MIRQLNPFTHIPKGLLGRTLADTMIINHQEYKSPAPEVKDILFRKYSKTEPSPLIEDAVENKKYLPENARSPISLSVNFNTPINNYLTPPNVFCEEINNKSKKSKSVGVNTEIPVNNALNEISIKIPTNLSKLITFFLLLSTFIGMKIILIKIKRPSEKQEAVLEKEHNCRENLFKKKD